MSVLRKITIWFLCLVCVTAVSGTVYILTLQSTLLDRSVVKQWLFSARVYDDNKLVNAIIQTPLKNSQPSDQFYVPTNAIKTAMSATFTPDFIKTQTERVVDIAYNWMEGKTPIFKFSIPIDTKQKTLIQQFATAIGPTVQTLLVCSHAVTNNCRPLTTTPSDFATEIATQSIKQSESFDKPITDKTFAEAGNKSLKKSEVVPLSQLPVIRSTINYLFIALPLISFFSIIALTLVSPASDRLKVFTNLARRLFFSLLLGVIISGVILWIARTSDFGLKDLLTTQSSALGGLLAPFLKNMIAGFAGSLLFWSGIFGGISFIIWIVLIILGKHLRKQFVIFPKTFNPGNDRNIG